MIITCRCPEEKIETNGYNSRHVLFNVHFSYHNLRSSRDPPEPIPCRLFFREARTVSRTSTPTPNFCQRYHHYTACSPLIHLHLILEPFLLDPPRNAPYHARTRPSRASPVASTALHIRIFDDLILPFLITIAGLYKTDINMAAFNEIILVGAKSSTNCGS